MNTYGDLVFDVGLHRGEDTAFYLAMGYRVVAFEANPDLVEACRRRFAREIGDGRLIVVDGAIHGGPDKFVTFYRHPFSAWGTLSNEWARRNTVYGDSRSVEVATVRFSDALREYGVPHYLKIDIEGSDRLCLEALRESEARPAYVSIESEKQEFDELIAEFDLLESLGYHRFAVVQQAGIQRPTLTTRIDNTNSTYTFEADASGPFGRDVGPWMSRDAALARYRSIFVRYRLFGDKSLLRRTRAGRILRGQLERRLRRPLPGWYDTHAALSDSEFPR